MHHFGVEVSWKVPTGKTEMEFRDMQCEEDRIVSSVSIHTYTHAEGTVNLHFVSFSEDTVIVTGFGPFGDHKINASWETVKLLPSLNIEEEFGVKLIIHEIPVTYDYVAENVPMLWKEHEPMVCIFWVHEHALRP